jgi:SAM-dependent methyltransferase
VDAQSWEDMYRSRTRVSSGAPNVVLVAEVIDLAPGQVLDVGCGEGADALWLAEQGWQVIAIDLSATALERADAADTGHRVHWTREDVTVTPPPPGTFDLISVQYFPLRIQPDHIVLRGLLGAVRAGGTFLFASHDHADLCARPEEGFNPADYYRPDDIARLLDHSWTVHINGTRPRAATPAGTHHTHDTVLRAQRLAV